MGNLQRLALVMSGGGAHGALQAGALRALWEYNVQPDLLVGTSIGAVNGAFIALKGWSQETLQALEDNWRQVAHENPLPGNYLWLSMSTVFGKPGEGVTRHLKDLFAAYGLTETMRFSETRLPLAMVASDLNCGEPVIYGLSPHDSVMEGLLTSTALPPWIRPIEKNGKTLVDGAFVSNLPLEPAMTMGAGEIIALDLSDTLGIQSEHKKSKPFLSKTVFATLCRQRSLEMALAQARNIPVRLISLRSRDNVTLWDFTHSAQLIEEGYEITCRAIAGL